jgi:hypothetical protein
MLQPGLYSIPESGTALCCLNEKGRKKKARGGESIIIKTFKDSNLSKLPYLLLEMKGEEKCSFLLK